MARPFLACQLQGLSGEQAAEPRHVVRDLLRRLPQVVDLEVLVTLMDGGPIRGVVHQRLADRGRHFRRHARDIIDERMPQRVAA